MKNHTPTLLSHTSGTKSPEAFETNPPNNNCFAWTRSFSACIVYPKILGHRGNSDDVQIDCLPRNFRN